MRFKDINLRKVEKKDLVECILKAEFENPSVKEKKEIRKIISSSTEDGEYIVAINALILGIYFDCNKTFQMIRKTGVFRYSKYTAKKCIVSNLVIDLLKIDDVLSFISGSHKKYLKSIINLSNLHTSFNQINIFLLAEIKSFRKNYKGKSLIKSLLSFVDFLFLSNHYPQSVIDLMQISSRTKEEVSSAVSYLIYFLSEKRSFDSSDTAFVSEEYIKSGEIERIIIATCYISDFKEFEILIDHFDYECVEFEDKLQIKPPSEDFEKSIQIGYIKSHIQSFNDVLQYNEIEDEKDELSLAEIVEEMNKLDEFNFFQLVETHNYPRYRIEIPEVVFEFIIDRFFKHDFLFKEEILYLSTVFKEQLLNPDDLRSLKIKDDLSLLEFIKISRVFTLFQLLFTKQVFSIEKVDTDLLLRSLVPVFPEEVFYNIIKKLTSIDNIDTFLDIVCWEPSLDILFDLQYHPILFLNKHFVIPLTILVNSNSIRNLYASEYKQSNVNLLTDGSVDALVEKLHRSFNKVGIQNYKQTPFQNTDIDLFAIYEDTIFLFECKQSLHPVNIFDLRTTFDYVKKAELQLDYLNREYKRGNLIEILESKCNIDLSGINKVVSCIVLSNRIFNGNAFKYPIRNISEIVNFLKQGTMRTNEGVFLLWKNDKLALSDLIDYFGMDSEIVKLTFDSVSVRTLSYELTSPAIEFDFYYLDFKVAIPLLNEFTSKLKKIS